MNKQIEDETIVYYNSSARKSYEAIDDHYAEFPSHMFSCKNDEYLEMELIQFNTSQSYYNLSNRRNTYFNYSEDGGLTQTVVALSEGNYNIKDLATNIQDALNAASTNVTFTVAHDLQTLKYTYTFSGTPSGSIIFSPLGSYRTMRCLGFANAAQTITSGIVSTQIVHIGNISALFLHANLSQSKHIFDYPDNSDSIFAEIPVISGSFGGVIYWEKTSDFCPKFKFPSSENNNVIHFQILDQFSNPVEMTAEYNMTLRLRTYKKNANDLKTLTSLMTYKLLSKEQNKK